MAEVISITQSWCQGKLMQGKKRQNRQDDKNYRLTAAPSLKSSEMGIGKEYKNLKNKLVTSFIDST